MKKPSILAAALVGASATLAVLGANSSLFDSGGAHAQTPVSQERLAYISTGSPVSRERLDAEISPLFDDEKYAETRAVVVMRNGKIIAERYAPGYGADTKFISWSMAKSVTAVLVGLMVADGRLVLDKPAPVPTWQRPGDPRGGITLRHLLNMASGLQHVEAGSPPYKSDEVRMLFLDGRDDMAAYARAKPLAHEPGSEFQYSTNTTVILSDILARTLTNSDDPAVRRDAMLEFLRGRLTGPIGMDSLTPEFDASGTMIGGSIMHATARDWARFGEFLRTKGSIAGNQVVPRGWIDFMLRPSPEDASYGGHIWLNRERPEGRNPVLFPGRGPASAFGCLGHLGQFIVVSPEQGLTVVRLGKTQDDVGAPLHSQLGEIVALFPRR